MHERLCLNIPYDVFSHSKTNVLVNLWPVDSQTSHFNKKGIDKDLKRYMSLSVNCLLLLYYGNNSEILRLYKVTKKLFNWLWENSFTRKRLKTSIHRYYQMPSWYPVWDDILILRLIRRFQLISTWLKLIRFCYTLNHITYTLKIDPTDIR